MEILNVNECASFNFLAQSSKRKAKSHSVKFKALNFELWFYAFRFTFFAILVFLCFSICPAAQAATYYVATNGNDTNTKSQAQDIAMPWKTIQHATDQLAPGDILYVRGGRYYESVTLTKQGTEGFPITIAAYTYTDPETQAQIREVPILDGTESVTNITGYQQSWARCTKDDPWFAGKNPAVNAAATDNDVPIWKIKIHSSKLPADLAKFMLFENGAHSRIARWPDQVIGYGIDMKLFNPVAPEAYGQTAYLLDTARLTQEDNYWAGAWIDVFSHAANAWVIRRTIASNSQSAHTITFDTPLANPISYGSTPDSYSIVNHPHVLDSPGEFAHVMAPEANGYYTFYLWPKDAANLTTKITIPSKGTAIFASVKSYITIDGLAFTGYTNNVIDIRGSTAAYIKNILVKNCTIEDSGGTGIYLVQADYSVIDHCIVNRVEGRGAMVNMGNYDTIKDCVICDTSSTNISFYTVTYGQMIRNTLYGCIGSHGNGSSCYLQCNYILLAFNYYPKSNLAMSEISNVVVYANVLDAEETTTQIVATWGGGVGQKGFHLYLNNTILGDNSGSSITLPDDYHLNGIYIINNILDGFNFWRNSSIAERTYNLYSAYGPYQSPSINWALGTGEIDGRSIALSSIFNNPGFANGGDYTLRAGSPVIAKGKDISNLLVTSGATTWFPDFDFTKDKAGNTWAATPSIGAYEYAPVNIIYGDISGDSALSAYDAALCARIAVGLDAYPTGDNLTKTDVSGDGFVTAYDAALIAQKAVGLIVKFPVES